MNTPASPGTPVHERPCVEPGCLATRHTNPSGFTSKRCHGHELQRVNRVKQRRVLDPLTGKTTTANALAIRKWRRAKAGATR